MKLRINMTSKTLKNYCFHCIYFSISFLICFFEKLFQPLYLIEINQRLKSADRIRLINQFRGKYFCSIEMRSWRPCLTPIVCADVIWSCDTMSRNLMRITLFDNIFNNTSVCECSWVCTQTSFTSTKITTQDNLQRSRQGHSPYDFKLRENGAWCVKQIYMYMYIQPRLNER